MEELYTCECRDGRTITGASRWSLYELRNLPPLELAKALEELLEFSRYYEATFYYPALSMKSEMEQLRKRLQKAKQLAVGFGAVTGSMTAAWLLTVLIPYLRFSGLAMLLAVLTIVSIVALIPFLFHYLSAQEDHSKRLPRIRAKLDSLSQQEEKEVYGEYIEYLIGGYLVSPEFSLSADAQEYMVQALRTKQAGNIAEAAMLCKKKFGKSPIPRIITSLQAVNSPARVSRPAPRAAESVQSQNQSPDMQLLLQLSGSLNSALQTYAATQKTTSTGPDSVAATLTYEEESLIEEYRYLQEDEKKRIRRVVHSFHTKKY